MIKLVAGVKIYGTEDIAQELGVTVPTVRSWIRAGKLRATKIGRGFMVTEEALRAFIAGEDQEPRPAPEAEEASPPAPEISAEDPETETPEAPGVRVITEEEIAQMEKRNRTE